MRGRVIAAHWPSFTMDKFNIPVTSTVGSSASPRGLLLLHLAHEPAPIYLAPISTTRTDAYAHIRIDGP